MDGLIDKFKIKDAIIEVKNDLLGRLEEVI